MFAVAVDPCQVRKIILVLVGFGFSCASPCDGGHVMCWFKNDWWRCTVVMSLEGAHTGSEFDPV